jgi:hypothetical protein
MSTLMPRRYSTAESPEPEVAPGLVWAQPKGKPRPGFGAVYVIPGSQSPQFPDEAPWSAQWIDEFDEPDENGELAGIENFEGSRNEVLAWARSQPARTRLMPTEADPVWVPLPEDDADVGP